MFVLKKQKKAYVLCNYHSVDDDEIAYFTVRWKTRELVLSITPMLFTEGLYRWTLMTCAAGIPDNAINNNTHHLIYKAPVCRGTTVALADSSSRAG